MCTNDQFWYNIEGFGGVDYNIYEGERFNKLKPIEYCEINIFVPDET